MSRSKLQPNIAEQLGITDENIRNFLADTKRRYRPLTQYNYALALEYAKRNVGKEDLLKWEATDVEKYIEWMEKNGCSVSTINNRIAALSAFFRYCEKKGLISNNPVTKVDLPRNRKGQRKPVFLNMEEVKKLLAYQRTTYNPEGKSLKDVRGIMVRSFLLTLIFTGTRVAKLCSLMLYDFVDLDTENPLLQIIDDKGGKSRDVPLHPVVIQAYTDWVAVRPKSQNKACYINLRTLQSLSPRTIQRHIKKLGEDAGIEKELTPHKMRHTLLLTDGKANIKDIQELLGHESPLTTMGYLHSDQRRRQEVIHNLLLDEEQAEE